MRFADDFCKKAETLIVDVLDSEGQDHVVDLADRDPPALVIIPTVKTTKCSSKKIV